MKGQNTRLLRAALKKYRKPMAIGLATLTLVDLLEVVPPLLLKDAVDAAVAGSATRALLRLAGLYLLVAFVQGLCRYAWRMYLIRSSMWAGRDLRNRLVDHLFGLSAHFYDRKRIGDLMSHATSDVEAIRMALGPGLLTFGDAVLYLLTVPVAMYVLSPRLTLFAMAPLLLIPFFVHWNQRKVHERFEALQESQSRISAVTQENLGGIRVVKAFAREDAQIQKFAALGEVHVQTSLSLARVQATFGPTLDFTMSLGLVALLYFGGKDVIGSVVTLGTFVAFQRYIEKMVWPMTALGMSVTYYQRALASSGRILELLEERTNVPDPVVPAVSVAPRAAARGKVEFRNLSFQFPGSDKKVLRDLNLVIEPGEKVAFLGAVGAGKSALLSLLVRLYPVERGMLFVDDIDVNDWSVKALRDQVGYVGQEVFLFSDTVAENLGYGVKNLVLPESGPHPLVQEAAQWAAVHDDVLGLSEGWGTRLGERGVNLSGGQKQRLTIARALARQPSILVLDDALSSVDVQTEERILQSLRSRNGRNTELVAAHRLSTVRDADRIITLVDGEFQQIGTHAELMKDRRGEYRRFHEQEQRREELESFIQDGGRP